MSQKGPVAARVISKYALYAFTIFLSAFLLFAVEPIAGKHVLPWFGGSSSIWATSLLFFTVMLFLGYLYVYILSRFSGKTQSAVHITLIALSSISAFASLNIWGGLLPVQETAAISHGPVLDLLRVLFFGIGAPYFALSTTGPLLQYWYGVSIEDHEAVATHGIATGTQSLRSRTGQEPYKLYALSNAGSLIALVSYPFLIEPNTTLHSQEFAWAVLFLIYVLVCIAAAVVHVGHSKGEILAKVMSAEGSASTDLTKSITWVSLAALPAFLLVSVTTHVTQVIAPVPLLWTVPLALYLLTFIVAFSGRARSVFFPLLLLASVFSAYAYNTTIYSGIQWQIISDLAILFFAGLCCHGRLYDLRPPTERLPFFYLMLSLGGLVGTVCASLIAPLVFPDFWEFPIGIALCAIYGASTLSEAFFPRILDTHKIRVTRYAFSIMAVMLLVQTLVPSENVPSIHSRNFYGAVSVRFDKSVTSLMHGGTLHGLQPTDPSVKYLPNTYYVTGSGVGRSILFEESLRSIAPTRIGIIGLGTGSMASYCRPKDTYVFYEIDPSIVAIAQTYFSYVGHCKGAEIRLGDARLVLNKEASEDKRGMYDVLVVDAFTDDTIPTHLLTTEAVALYKKHLRDEQSIIAVHISNRYLDLAPVVEKIGLDQGLAIKVVTDSGSSSEYGSPSQWVLLTKDAKVFDNVAFSNSTFSPSKDLGRVWSDEYISLLPILRIPFLW